MEPQEKGSKGLGTELYEHCCGSCMQYGELEGVLFYEQDKLLEMDQD
jgi:hypothetical protein